MADVVLKAVEKLFGAERVVKSIDLSVKNGEFFSLLGPSGCGKTTTLRIIAGLETPSSGDVLIGGQRMNDIPINRRPTNLVFQKHALFPHLNVFDNVAFGLRLKRIGQAELARRVEEMLDVVNLSGFEGRRVAGLSGGQQQRVAVARALVNQPDVLLLDEPLGALDFKLQLRLQRELKRIQRSTGTTFIYVTHNQAEALSLSDRLAVMNGGVVEQVGTPAEMYLRPATSFVASFIGQTNLIEGKVLAVEDGLHRIEDGEFSMLVDTVPSAHLGERVTLSLRPERIAISPDAGMTNQAEGVVTEVAFLGATVLYRVRLADGRRLQVQSLANVAPLGEGHPVRLGWSADSAVPIRATSLAEDSEE